MYFIERLLLEYGKNPDVTHLVDTRSFYFLPIWDADRGERILTRHPAWPGHKPEEQVGKDLDGDGYITQIRVNDDSVEEGYRYYLEGPGVDPVVPVAPGGMWQYPYGILSGSGPVKPDMNRQRNELTGERERADFNRNWSGLWTPEQSGSGPYPFSRPEVRAVADFITTSHKNIYFAYSIHAGGANHEGRSYLVRPIMDKSYDQMHHEDNDFYVRAGAIWSYLTGGNVVENNYMSFMYNTSQEDEEGKQRGYSPTGAGYFNDYLYLQLGIHSVLPEVSGLGIDYDNDGYLTWPEKHRWHKEDMGYRWFSPWKSFNHPVLGEVEIGGLRTPPPTFGEWAKTASETQYDWLLYIADLSPLLRIKNVKTESISGGRYKITATVRNEGKLSTYITRNAIAIRRDYPVVAQLELENARIIDEQPEKSLGHILGTWAYIRYWIQGEDRSEKTVEWIVEPTGTGPIKVSVEAWAQKAGGDKKTIILNK